MVVGGGKLCRTCARVGVEMSLKYEIGSLMKSPSKLWLGFISTCHRTDWLSVLSRQECLLHQRHYMCHFHRLIANNIWQFIDNFHLLIFICLGFMALFLFIDTEVIFIERYK